MLRIDETATTNRETQILDAITSALVRVPIEWSAIQCSCPGHTGILYVSSDAVAIRAMWNLQEKRKCDQKMGVLYVPQTEAELEQCTSLVRVNVTAKSAQQAVDALGVALPTTKIADLIRQQCGIKLPPYTDTPDSAMADTSRMVKHSGRIDAGKAGKVGLTCNVGKHWVLTNGLNTHPGKAANYGWYDASAPNIAADGKTHLWQSLGFAHNLAHVDYSQTLTVVSTEMVVDGQSMCLWDVLKSPELCGLVSYEGPVTITRLPNVPFYSPAGGSSAPATPPTIPPPTMPSPPPAEACEAIRMVKARYFTAVPRSKPRKIELVVIHVMQAAEKPNTALAVGKYFQSKMLGADGNPRPASTHYGVDAAEVVQYVEEEDVAYGAPGTNNNGIHVELAGYSEQTPSQWADEYSRTELARAAKLVADICSRREIPATFVEAETLVVGGKGITTHAEVSRACQLAKKWGRKESPFFKATGSHTDPGKNFPLQSFMQQVTEQMGVADG